MVCFVRVVRGLTLLSRVRLSASPVCPGFAADLAGRNRYIESCGAAYRRVEAPTSLRDGNPGILADVESWAWRRSLEGGSATLSVTDRSQGV
jgi:hypothetical protein